MASFYFPAILNSGGKKPWIEIVNPTSSTMTWAITTRRDGQPMVTDNGNVAAYERYAADLTTRFQGSNGWMKVTIDQPGQVSVTTWSSDQYTWPPVIVAPPNQ